MIAQNPTLTSLCTYHEKQHRSRAAITPLTVHSYEGGEKPGPCVRQLYADGLDVLASLSHDSWGRASGTHWACACIHSPSVNAHLAHKPHRSR